MIQKESLAPVNFNGDYKNISTIHLLIAFLYVLRVV